MTDRYHITIDGRPACERDADSIAAMEDSHASHTGLICSHSSAEVLNAVAAIYRRHRPQSVVAVNVGGCPAGADYDPWQ